MIGEINIQQATHGVYMHNDVVPGVERVVLALNGNFHNEDADDFQGKYIAGGGGIQLNSAIGDYGMSDNEVVLKCEKEKSKMTYSVNQERGFATHVITLEIYVPHLSLDIYNRLNSGLRTAYVGLVCMNDKFEQGPPYETDDNTDAETAPSSTDLKQARYIVGVDQILGDVGSVASSVTPAGQSQIDFNFLYSDFALFIDSIEYDSGAALTDKNGATLRLTSVQGTAPKHVFYVS